MPSPTRHAGASRAARLLTTTLAAVMAAGLLAQDAAPPDARAQVLTRHRDAEQRLEALDRAATVAEARTALQALAGALDAVRDTAALPADLRADVGTTSARVRAMARGTERATLAALMQSRHALAIDSVAIGVLLDRVRDAAGAALLDLDFQGSFSETRTIQDQALGGHASAMGPAPAPAPADRPLATAPAHFTERPTLPTTTWAGGPTKDHILESAGNGVALFDYDGDGWLDVYLVTAAQIGPGRVRVPHRNALYRNHGQWQFEDVSARAGVDAATWGSGACVADVDGDGRLDLYVTAWDRNLLYRNRGDGTFEDVAAQAGVAASGWSTGCAFFDADADGDLDLYVARYVATTWDDVVRARRTLRWRDGPAIMVGPAGLPGEADLYFENDGHGRFREVSAARGLADTAAGYGFGVVATDVDADGRVDLFVANDSTPNFLYRNVGDGRFESVGLLAGVAVNAEARAQAGMGVDAGDLDGDGRQDLVLTAFAHDRNTIYRNLGDGLFEDASVLLGLASTTFARMGWGVATLDADLDARLDLFVANGHIFADVGDFPALGETFAQANQLLLNDGARLRDGSAAAGPGLAVTKVSRGLAVGDLDNDGDLDVVVSNVDDTPTLLENTQRTGHHWIGVQVAAPVGNRFAIGARVEITSGGQRQVREVRSGGSYLSQSDLRVFAGLGTDTAPVRVDVQMPGGARWRWDGLAVDRLHRLTLRDEARVTGSAPR